jgi:hypothetical protein
VATTEYVKNSITAASAGLSTIGVISGTSMRKVQRLAELQN